MRDLSRRQLTVLVLFATPWGVQWPIMKLGVPDVPPPSFRQASMWVGEVLRWQDWAAVALTVSAIASVRWPRRKP